MITIQKFELSILAEQTIDVPAGAGLPLALFVVGDRPPTPTVWYVVDDSAPLVKRTIFCVRDGDAAHPISGRHSDPIGSVLYPPTATALHYFQKRFT